MKWTKNKIILGTIFLLALVMRIIAAHNTHVSTDEMIYTIIPWNIIGSGQLGTIEQSPLHFYLTDIGYKLLGGITGVSVRFPAIIFGALTTLVIFLIARRLFNTKAGLISAFLFAVSGYAVKYNYEMDMGAFFFALLAMYFFMLFVDSKKSSNLYLTAILFGLAILIKNIVIIFVPVFLLYLYLKKVKFDQVLFKKLLVACVVLLVVLSPVFIYNYITYQEHGFTDYYFSNIAGIGETVHQGLEGKPWSWQSLQKVTIDKFTQLAKIDTLTLFFGTIGIFYCYRRRKAETIFLFGSLLLFHLYIAGQTGSKSHYLWIPMLLSIFASGAIIILSQKIRKNLSFKNMEYFVIALVLLSSFFLVQDVVASRDSSITLELRDYVHQNIPENAVVVIDPRIYRGIHAWVFSDKHYLEGTQFNQLVNSIDQIPGSSIDVPLYYIECGEGTNCGWKPEDFARVFDAGEQISEYFSSQLEPVATIDADHKFNIYKGSGVFPSGIYEPIDRSHVFWFYPIGWHYPELAVDYYEVTGFKKLLHGVGMLILYVNILLVLLSILFLLRMSFWRK